MSTKPLKFPLELYSNPNLPELNLFQAGLLRLLVERYWITGIPIPKSESAFVRSIIVDWKTYERHKKKAWEAYNILLPDIKRERESKQGKRLQMQKNAEKARVALKAKVKSRDILLSDEQDSHQKINAVLSSPEKSRYHQGQYDPVARNQAIENNKNADDVLFSDS